MKQASSITTKPMGMVGLGARLYPCAIAGIDWPTGRMFGQAALGLYGTHVSNGIAVRLQAFEGSSG